MVCQAVFSAIASSVHHDGELVLEEAIAIPATRGLWTSNAVSSANSAYRIHATKEDLVAFAHIMWSPTISCLNCLQGILPKFVRTRRFVSQ
jgi:hypothetical protein